MSETFVDQLHQAVDTFYWLDDRSERSYIEQVYYNLAWLVDVSEGSDY